MLQTATAVRVVTALEDMDTIWALPVGVRCVSLGWLGGVLVLGVVVDEDGVGDGDGGLVE